MVGNLALAWLGEGCNPVLESHHSRHAGRFCKPPPELLGQRDDEYPLRGATLFRMFFLSTYEGNSTTMRNVLGELFDKAS